MAFVSFLNYIFYIFSLFFQKTFHLTNYIAE